MDMKRDRHSKFEESLDSQTGIQMAPMASPMPPSATHYRQETDAGKVDMSYMTPVMSQRTLYARGPDNLYSYGSNVPRTRMDDKTERLIAYRATQSAQWHVHWRIPTLIGVAFFLGVILAILQHVLYSYLHEKHFDDENRKFRAVLYGRALAYFAKVAFGGSVVLVYRHRIWRVFRERPLSVASIDQVFGATEDPRLFLNWEAWSNAPVIVAMAIVIWAIPLATIIFSPGALTFGNTMKSQQITNNDSLVINFASESKSDWRRPVKSGVADDNQRSVMYYNTTDKTATKPGWFDYYDQPSAELRKIALLLAYSDASRPNLYVNTRDNFCEKGFNCTLEQTFLGPGYDCSIVASGLQDTDKLRQLGAPFNLSVLVPEGRAVYYSEVDLGAYARPQPGQFEKLGGIPIGNPDPDLGVFKSEPVLWIGTSTNSSVLLDQNDPYTKNWTHRYDPKMVRCVHKETKYTVKWNFTETYFTTDVRREYLEPIVNTNIAIGRDGFVDRKADPVPKEKWISPRGNVELYKKTAAYHALGEVFRDFLRGQIDLDAPKPGPSYPTISSDITKTRLVQKTSEPKTNLTDEIEFFYTNLVLSLHSIPKMLAVVTAADKVNQSRYQSTFVYFPKRLWQVYAPVIFVVLIIILLGALTIWQDGTTFSAGFSRILVTTRNTTLDDISRGACLGNDPFPGELMHTKLKFGVLANGSAADYVGGDADSGIGHCAFGVASEIAPIRRGAPYAGLPDSGLKRRNIYYDKEQ